MFRIIFIGVVFSIFSFSVRGFGLTSITQESYRSCIDTGILNGAPKLDGPFYYWHCEGQKICFDVRSRDRPVVIQPMVRQTPDTTYLTWNNSIPNATFSIKNPNQRERVGQFCWIPEIGSGRSLPYSFLVTVEDRHPIQPMSETKTYSIELRELPKVEKYIVVENGNELVARLVIRNGSFGYSTCSVYYKDSIGYRYYLTNTPRLKLNPWNDSIYELRRRVNYVGKVYIDFRLSSDVGCPIALIDSVFVNLPTFVGSLSNKIRLSYNSSQGSINVQDAHGMQRLVLMDIAGKKVDEHTANGLGIYSLNPLSKGVYVVLLEMKDGSIFREKITVQ